MRTLLGPSFLSLTVVLAACGDDGGAVTDAALPDVPTVDAIDAPIDAPAFVPPTMLSQTGLYSDIATKTIAPGVIEFAPRWELWSDDAAKRRWISLPTGARIDTTDMNHWRFPQGTKLWKEFVRGGDRIETRLMQKVGTTDAWTDWYIVSFQWDAAETEAMAVPDGTIDEAGVNDIPPRADCRKCHGDNRMPSVVIGLSALQLDRESATLDLHDLVTMGVLTAPPTGGSATTPYFPLPAGDVERAAFGYLHANCGNCHNPQSDVLDTVDLVLRQDLTDLASWGTTAAFETSVDVPNETSSPGADRIVHPGSPAASALYYRMTTLGGQRMPPVGRELADPTGTEAVRQWILSLGAQR